MTPFSEFLPDDPRLTAFALGELEGEELAAVEAALREDPAARAAVEEIRATVAQMESALAMETVSDQKSAETSPLQRAAIVPGHDRSKLDGGPLGKLIAFPRLKFPQFYYVVGGLAAAAFAVLLAYREQPVRSAAVFKEAEKKNYMEVSVAARMRDQAVLSQARQLSAAADMDKAPVASSRAAAPAAVSANTPMAIAQNRFIQSTHSYDRKQVVADNVQAQTAGKDAEAQKPVEVAPTVAAGSAGGIAKFADVAAAPAQPRLDDSAVLSKLAEDTSRSAGYLKINSGTATRIGMEVQRTPPIIGGAYGSRERYYIDTVGNKVRDTQLSWDARGAFITDSATSPAQPKTQANTESYAYRTDNSFLDAKNNPLSTFSVDVDTASYANVRRFITQGQLPPPDAVRIEEMVNYFPYHYAPPVMATRGEEDAVPFAASMEVAAAPWAPTHRLVRIGLKGREVTTAARAAANLVFLLDVSGSMDEPNKLPLVKESMRLLISKLRPDDRVAIVVYAGASGLALPSTPVAKSQDILSALDALAPGGSTNGAMGIELAYDIAKPNFVAGGLNRVILCTDGDFNVGVTNEGQLTRLIEEKAKSGVFLTVLGFGMGNIKDSTLELLADKGNGHYAYIDTRREAEKTLVEQVNGTLVTIAKDVKLQVEFNPTQVASYRLIGYENRLLKKEDFNNDAVDAGEIGAGHTVTALYEIVPVGSSKDGGRATKESPTVDALKYGAVSDQRTAIGPADQKADSRKRDADRLLSRELLTLKIRYKEPAGAVSRKLEFTLTDAGARFAEASSDFKFAAAVAEFGMILRNSPHKGTATLEEVRAWAEAGTEGDAGGYRSEFVELVRNAETLLR